jgi:hypothetical protein
VSMKGKTILARLLRRRPKRTLRELIEQRDMTSGSFEFRLPVTNMFQECENVTQLINQVIGAGSTCWVDSTGDNEFDTSTAQVISDDAVDRLIELGWAAPGERHA